MLNRQQMLLNNMHPPQMQHQNMLNAWNQFPQAVINNNQPVPIQQNKYIPKQTKAELLKEEQRETRKELNEEITKLSRLTKKQLRKYFQDQINEVSDEEEE